MSLTHVQFLFKQADETNEWSLLNRADIPKRCVSLFSEQIGQEIAIVFRAHTYVVFVLFKSERERKGESLLSPKELFTSSKLIAQLNEDE